MQSIPAFVAGLLVANLIAQIAPSSAADAVVGLAILIVAGQFIWRFVVTPIQRRRADEQKRQYAAERFPDAPRTPAGYPMVADKHFTRAFPYGCPDADVTKL